MPGWLALADILRMSDDDLAFIAPELTLDEAFAAWHRAGVALAVVTRGAEGAVASLAGARVEVPPVRVDLVDTVGAGDSFTAGLLDWLARHGHLGGRLERLTPADVERALSHAAAIAARTCSVRGADPPWAEPATVRPT